MAIQFQKVSNVLQWAGNSLATVTSFNWKNPMWYFRAVNQGWKLSSAFGPGSESLDEDLVLDHSDSQWASPESLSQHQPGSSLPLALENDQAPDDLEPEAKKWFDKSTGERFRDAAGFIGRGYGTYQYVMKAVGTVGLLSKDFDEFNLTNDDDFNFWTQFHEMYDPLMNAGHLMNHSLQKKYLDVFPFVEETLNVGGFAVHHLDPLIEFPFEARIGARIWGIFGTDESDDLVEQVIEESLA